MLSFDKNFDNSFFTFNLLVDFRVALGEEEALGDSKPPASSEKGLLKLVVDDVVDIRLAGTWSPASFASRLAVSSKS